MSLIGMQPSNHFLVIAEAFQTLLSWMSLIGYDLSANSGRVPSVSNLVVVDVAHWQGHRITSRMLAKVSNLVVVDVAHWLASHVVSYPSPNSFKPCCRGCRSLAVRRGCADQTEEAVSNLVVVDVGHWPRKNGGLTRVTKVSNLVVVDVGPWQRWHSRDVRAGACFKPCCRGCRSLAWRHT